MSIFFSLCDVLSKCKRELYHFSYIKSNVCVGFMFFVLSDNVALNKQTYQQYPYTPGDDTYNANNAVDGRKSNPNVRGGQCAASYLKQTATWWVNLTTIHSIHHITIYLSMDNVPGKSQSLCIL